MKKVSNLEILSRKLEDSEKGALEVSALKIRDVGGKDLVLGNSIFSTVVVVSLLGFEFS